MSPAGGARPALGIDRSIRPTRRDLGDGSSWVDEFPSILRDPDTELQSLIAADRWSQGQTWRYDRYVDERRLGAFIPPRSLSAPVRQLGMHLEAHYRVPLSGVSVVYYRDGDDFQGMHTDREMRWLDDTLIAITVLGERRPFVLRPRGIASERFTNRDHSNDVVLTPGDGDVIVLGGRSQRDWLHGIPPQPAAKPRISLIWRWTAKTGEPDTGPSYFDGRHYSDAPAGLTRSGRPAGGSHKAGRRTRRL